MIPLPYPNEPAIDVGLLLAALDWPGEYVEDPITWSMIVALWRSHLCEDLREAARRAKSEDVEIIPVVISGPTSKRHTRAKGAEVEVYRTLMLRFGELRSEPDSPFMRLVRVLKIRGVDRHPKEQEVSARAEKRAEKHGDRLGRAIEEIVTTARLEQASGSGAARLVLDVDRLFEEFGAPGKYSAVGLGIEGRTVVVSRRLITQVRRAIARHDDTTCFVDLPEAGQPRLCFRWKRGLGGLNFYSDADRSKIRREDIAWIVYGGATILEVPCPDHLAAPRSAEVLPVEAIRLEARYPEAFEEQVAAAPVVSAPAIEAPPAELPPPVTAKRSEAALKAWATRRRQGWTPTKEPRPEQAERAPDAIPTDLAQKRTEAARRAWATRRAQGWTSRRSAAA